MKYYIREEKRPGPTGRTAWSKARADAETICAEEGFAPVDIPAAPGDRENAGLFGKLLGHVRMDRIWRGGFKCLAPGDELVLQLPPIHNCFFLGARLRRLRRRGVRLIGVVHDLETLRLSLDRDTGLLTRLRMHTEENGVVRACGRLIVHNEKMRGLLAARGIDAGACVPLGLFDYLMTPSAEDAAGARENGCEGAWQSFVIAGNLDPAKAGYVYRLPAGIDARLYGVNFDTSRCPAGQYMGSYPPDRLPEVLDGGFGLVWDGPSADSCQGIYGEYLRYNNPHKLSLYLASGLPVVIWSQAALAGFVTEEGAGFTADTLPQAAERLARMTRAEYDGYRRAAARIGRALRRGEYLRRALRTVEDGYD